MDLFDLTGKRAIITGAAGDLGKAMAEGLYRAGARIAILDISDKLEQAVKEIDPSAARVHGVRADLSDRQDIRRAFGEAVDALGGGLDILINNAGIQRRHPVLDYPLDDWDDILEVNLTAVFILCQLAGRLMIEQKYGKIINIASMTAFVGGYSIPAYTASKAGVAQLTKALSNEWAQHGLNINAIAPGYMLTELSRPLVTDKEKSKEILARIPAGRLGKPSDLIGTAIFLSSSASDYLNGAVIPVDGGYLGKG
ncbi:MAG TPA: SDR family NAD(P)-dependent oxidoreductase [Clostridia bacterium]|nr:SDR family NAD(P)-dependent oxidoreductase [Clostridia bacterium]